MSKAKMGTPPKKPTTIKEWYELGPSSKVTRAELMMVLEGFEFVPAQQIGEMMQRALVLDRERKWYRRLWRWIKVSIFKKQTLKDVSKDARDRIRAELDKADELDRKQEELEDETDAKQADADSAREAASD